MFEIAYVIYIMVPGTHTTCSIVSMPITILVEFSHPHSSGTAQTQPLPTGIKKTIFKLEFLTKKLGQIWLKIAETPGRQRKNNNHFIGFYHF